MARFGAADILARNFKFIDSELFCSILMSCSPDTILRSPSRSLWDKSFSSLLLIFSFEQLKLHVFNAATAVFQNSSVELFTTSEVSDTQSRETRHRWVAQSFQFSFPPSLSENISSSRIKSIFNKVLGIGVQCNLRYSCTKHQSLYGFQTNWSQSFESKAWILSLDHFLSTLQHVHTSPACHPSGCCFLWLVEHCLLSL